MPDTYDHITLLCRLKAAQTRIKELESGERYIRLQELHQKEYRAYERKLLRSARDLADAHKDANYAQTECQFRYCGTAIPFLTVRSTAR